MLTRFIGLKIEKYIALKKHSLARAFGSLIVFISFAVGKFLSAFGIRARFEVDPAFSPA
jgi:hypothetical protein